MDRTQGGREKDSYVAFVEQRTDDGACVSCPDRGKHRPVLTGEIREVGEEGEEGRRVGINRPNAPDARV